jgi:hypothetical protein
LNISEISVKSSDIIVVCRAFCSVGASAMARHYGVCWAVQGTDE